MRRGAGLLWCASVLVAAVLGWGAGRFDGRVAPVTTVQVEAPVAAPSPLPSTARLVEVETAAATPAPTPRPFRPSLEPVEEPPPAPPPPRVMLAVPEPVLPAAPDPPPPSTYERARSADRLAESGETDQAKAEAEALLAEFASYTGLESALVAGGADVVRAQLTALRVIQVAGLIPTSQEVARELKRSYSSTAEVVESIRQWGILSPRIDRLEPSIVSDRGVVVSGTLQNPDIVEIRRVHVKVEALDAAGNLLDAEQVRVTPKVLGPGERGDFRVTFGRVDPKRVLRTRATVVEWESAVLDAG